MKRDRYENALRNYMRLVRREDPPDHRVLIPTPGPSSSHPNTTQERATFEKGTWNLMHRWEVVAIKNHPYLETPLGEEVVSRHLFRLTAEHVRDEYTRLARGGDLALSAAGLNPLITYVARRKP